MERAQHSGWDSGQVGFIYAMKNQAEFKYNSYNGESITVTELLDLSISSYTKIGNNFQNPSFDTLKIISKKHRTYLGELVYDGKEENRVNDTDRI